MTFHPTQPAARPLRPAPRSRRRRGVILLFVVVLLTLLAIVGSAFLISTRIDANQVGPEARGKGVDIFGADAKQRLGEVRAQTIRAAQLALFLDLFDSARVGSDRLTVNRGTATPPTNYLAAASAAREWPDGSHVFPDTTETGPHLWPMWRGDRSAANAVYATYADYAALTSYPVLAGADTYANLAYGAGGFAAAPSNNYADLFFPYYPVDALGQTDPHLAARRPVVTDIGGSPADYSDDSVTWDWVSGPLVGLPGFEVDNLYVDPSIQVNSVTTDFVTVADLDAAPAARSQLSPWVTGGVEYAAPSQSNVNDEYYNDRWRTLPALFRDANANGRPDGAENVFTAADADGDGVADSALVPIVFRKGPATAGLARGQRDRYIDPVTGYAYLVGVRIVDNNDAINLNTAASREGDVVLPAFTGITAATTPNREFLATELEDYDLLFTGAPNFGIWPSNVALYEYFALRSLGLNDDVAADPNGGGLTYATSPPNFGERDGGETLASTAARDLFGGLLGGGVAGLDVTFKRLAQALRSDPDPDVVAATLGEVLNFGVSRRLANPATLGDPDATDTALPAALPAPVVDDATLQALHYAGGGLIVPEVDADRLTRANSDLFEVMTGNFAPSDDLIFTAWPAVDPTLSIDDTQRRIALWARLFKSADIDQTRLVFERNEVLGGSGGDVVLPISPRAALVGRNGVSQAFSPKMLNPAADPNGNGVAAATELSEATLPDGMAPYADAAAFSDVRPPVRAGLNTASFGELWRAYWNVMVDTTGGGDFTAPPASGIVDPTDDEFDPAKVAGGTALTRQQVLLLRAALAAVNTMDIRDVERTLVDAGTSPTRTPGLPVWGDSDVTVAEINLGAFGGGGVANLKARVYGTEAQPFISEVILDVGTSGSIDYAAVELINPYPFPIVMRGWQLVAANPNGALAPVTLATFGSTTAPLTLPEAQVFVDPGPDTTLGTADDFLNIEMGRLVITGGTEQNGAITVTDDDATVPAGDTDNVLTLTDHGLTLGSVGSIEDNALVLMRPAVNPSTDANVVAAGEMVPLDMVDVRGFDPSYTDDTVNPDDIAGPVRLRYARDDSDARNWQYVFHGKWDGDRATTPLNNKPVSVGLVARYSAGDMDFGGELGTPNATPTVTNSTATSSSLPTTVDPEEDNAAVAATGGFPVGPVLSGRLLGGDATAAAYDGKNFRTVYPYGGFARDGDAYQVPILGAYTLFIDANTNGYQPAEAVSLRSVTLDTEHSDTDSNELWGRFIFREAADENGDGTAFQPVYAWAADLLDYVTANDNFGDDTYPNADLRYALDQGGTSVGDRSLDASGTLPDAFTPSYAASNSADTDVFPAGTFPLFDSVTAGLGAIDNDGDGEFGLSDPANTQQSAAARYVEAFLPAQGKINVLTAGAGILKAAPLATTAAGTADAATITGTANTLLTNLDAATGERTAVLGNGVTTAAITTLGDLNVFGPVFTSGGDRYGAGDLTGQLLSFNGAGVATNVNHYDVAPPMGGPPDLSSEANTADLTRVSNLLTTRSDSYTVYIVVQAWENFGSDGSGARPPARIVRQERVAFTVDRSGVYPTANGLGLPGATYATPNDALEALEIEVVPVE